MVNVAVASAPRLSGPEPAVAAGGAGVMGAAWTLPALWSHGVNPVPPCLFHLVTGQPCPLCGGTRSFAAMAHGNLGAAVRVYPIGPLLFAVLVLAVAASVVAVLSGRRLRLELDARWRHRLLLAAVVVLALNWAAKLFVLGY